MSKKTTDTSKVEETEDVIVEETEEETEEESEEQSEDESEEETEDPKDTKKDTELDLDAELEKEEKGKPDLNKAKDAFKERKEKRVEDTDEDEDKPLTRKDLDKVRSEVRQELHKERALEIARSMAGSDKEAQLIVAKWSNRTFPESLTLSEQIEEAYAITHRKKLIGERNEALRALKGKSGINTNGAGAHKDPLKGNAPKLSAQDDAAIKAAGFAWNGATRRFEKKLGNGSLLIKDPKTKQTRLLPKK